MYVMYSDYIPPVSPDLCPTQCSPRLHIFFFFNNPLSSICATYICTGVEPYHLLIIVDQPGTIPLKKTDSLSQKPLVINSFPTPEFLPLPCQHVKWLDLMQAAIAPVSPCVQQSCHAQKILFTQVFPDFCLLTSASSSLMMSVSYREGCDTDVPLRLSTLWALSVL